MQSALPQGSAVVSEAAETFHMPIKSATAFRAMNLARVKVFGTLNEEFQYI